MRDDLIKVTDPWFWKYKAARYDGASHEAALQSVKCEQAAQRAIAEHKRMSEQMKWLRLA